MKLQQEETSRQADNETPNSNNAPHKETQYEPDSASLAVTKGKKPSIHPYCEKDTGHLNKTTIEKPALLEVDLLQGNDLEHIDDPCTVTQEMPHERRDSIIREPLYGQKRNGGTSETMAIDFRLQTQK